LATIQNVDVITHGFGVFRTGIFTKIKLNNNNNRVKDLSDYESMQYESRLYEFCSELLVDAYETQPRQAGVWNCGFLLSIHDLF
jgi:hypothetical protein